MPVWFADKSRLWRIAFVALTVMALGMALAGGPALVASLVLGPMSLPMRLGGGLAMLVIALPLYAILFVLAKAPPVALRAACAFAGLAWLMFTGVSVMIALVEATPGAWSPAFAIPGLCGLVLLLSAGADHLGWLDQRPSA